MLRVRLGETASRCRPFPGGGGANVGPGPLGQAPQSDAASPVSNPALSRTRVLERLRTVPHAPSVPKPPAGRERKQQPAVFAHAGAETICASTTPGLNHKLRTGFKTLWIGKLLAGLASLMGAAGKSTLTAR